MPLDKTARAFVPRVDQVPESLIDVPHVQVTCQCPAPCWAAISTVEGLKATGLDYKYHCNRCCPDEFRGQLQAVADRARADPHRDKSKAIAGIFSKNMGLVLEGMGPGEIAELVRDIDKEHPKERHPVTVTMTLDVGEWVDMLTCVGYTVEWQGKRKPNDPVHPRGATYMNELYEKLKRYVQYEIKRQVP